jgi:signal transduction histidine kinase
LVLATLLPLTLAGGAGAVLTLRSQKQAVERQAHDLARYSATLLARELVANQRSVQMISQSPLLDGELDPARFELLASRLVLDEPTWRAISVATPNGARLLDVPGPIGGQPGGGVVEPLSLERTVSLRRPTIGDVVAGPRGRPAFAIRAPVVRGERVRFVVSAIVDTESLSRLVLTEEAPSGWMVQVLDRRGVVIMDATRDDGAGRAGRVAPRPRETTPPGMAQVVAPVRGSDWSVRVLAPSGQWDGPGQMAVLVGLLAGGLGLLLAMAATRRLLSELRREREAERTLGEARRLEALGQMTGGVAHDFNNLLTPIIGGLDLLQKRLPDDPRASRILEGALQSAERARTLVSRLLSFARQQHLAVEAFDVAVLLRGLTDLVERTIGAGITVSLELSDQSLWTRADASQLELAVLNLAVNARDAMPNGGELRICADVAAVTDTNAGLAAGRYVRISVIDSGEGMDAQTLTRALDPFFTTKPVGKGTGLGLSMAHAAAAQWGGALRLSSTPGDGTCVELWLPWVSPGRPTPPVERADLSGTLGRVLLVDDDDLVREATAAMLRDHGHAVTEAGSVSHALRCLTLEVPDLVVTDYRMPGQSGGDLIRLLTASHPALPVLLITGFAAEDEVPGAVARLAKPFRSVELLACISQLLESRAKQG